MIDSGGKGGSARIDHTDGTVQVGIQLSCNNKAF